MTNLSDTQWMCIAHLFDNVRPPSRVGRPPANARAILNAIRWVQRTGERWIYLPSAYPPQQTCYIKYLTWKRSGLLGEVERLLAACCADKTAPRPRAG